MVQPTDILTDALLTHQIDLFRLTAGEQRKTLNLLREMQAELVLVVNNGATPFSKARAQRLITQAKQVIDDYYGRANTGLDMAGIAAHEAEITVNTMTGIGLTANLPSETMIRGLVNGVLIQGASSAEWWSRQAGDMRFRFANAVRQGVVQGETIQQITARIVGGKGQPGIMDIPRRNATTLVHESVMAICNDTRMKTYRENADIVKGVRQLSTFDSRTTPICLAYAGGEWDLEGNPIGDTALPYVNEAPGANPNGGTPRHWGCRSTMVPVLKTWAELGIDAPELPTGMRASDLGQIDANITADEWLKRHGDEFADKLLGKGKAGLYREGKITLSDLVSGKGRELTLEQLRKKAA